MKSSYKFLILSSALSAGVMTSCKRSVLEKAPLGSTSEATLANKAGVNGLLIGAYSMLDGIGGPGGGGAPYSQSVTNWVFGGVASDDAHKGSTDNDQTAIANIERYEVNSSTSYLNGKWIALYTGVQRANDVLRVMEKVTDGSISETEMPNLRAEAIFLRAVYHFEAVKLWRNVPYLDETKSYENGNFNVPNTTDVWPLLEADFQYAIDNLNDIQPQRGRANSWAAKAFLAKVYMFQHKFTQALPLLEDLIQNGVTASGQPYALVNFYDNFNPATDNSAESVFAVQMSVKDGSAGSLNGRIGDILNFPYGGPTTCCGFYQPSFSIVNSFKTDPVSGLPMVETFNDADVTNDQGLTVNDPFTPYTGTLDPRLDRTVGRRGLPYLDWGLMPGASWVRSQAQAGPYLPIKNVVSKAQAGTAADVGQGWAVNQATSINYQMIRFADILLWAAEAEVEVGSLDNAQAYVNMIRNRAADPAMWVKTYVDNSDPSKGFTNTPAANYKIEPYPTGMFAMEGKEFARHAVWFERKLEFAMEGHRFFDLQRYDGVEPGYMADLLNAYIQHETSIPGYDYAILNGAVFTEGRNEIFPIPLAQIDLSATENGPTLVQNPNYD